MAPRKGKVQKEEQVISLGPQVKFVNSYMYWMCISLFRVFYGKELFVYYLGC